MIRGHMGLISSFLFVRFSSEYGHTIDVSKGLNPRPNGWIPGALRLLHLSVRVHEFTEQTNLGHYPNPQFLSLMYILLIVFSDNIRKTSTSKPTEKPKIENLKFFQKWFWRVFWNRRFWFPSHSRGCEENQNLKNEEPMEKWCFGNL